MAISADTLSDIIKQLGDKFNFPYDEAIGFLAQEQKLPKKLLPKEAKSTSLWASSQAQALAEKHNIVHDGTKGSGKDGKWTMKDVEKFISKEEKINASPTAEILAKEKGISLFGKTGSGTNGRILLKDVSKWIESPESDEDGINTSPRALNISPRALLEAREHNISEDELAKIKGSGEDGRIILADIETYKSESSDKEDKKKDKKKKKKSKKDDWSDDDSDSDWAF